MSALIAGHGSPDPTARVRPARAGIGSRIAAVAATAVLVTAGCGLLDPDPVDTVGKIAFDTALAIPPLAPSRVAADGRRVFELTAQPGRSEFRPGQRTDTWGFNGAYLGPT